jgi:energy-coupling factor transporter ATP-binding protein EcfA2
MWRKGKVKTVPPSGKDAEAGPPAKTDDMIYSGFTQLLAMSAINLVHIRRFKRLLDVTVNLGEVTVLVGANNSGKSSVLQAIHFAVSIAQSARLVGEGVSWRNDVFQLSFNPAQLIYSPVADVMSLASGGTLQEAATARIEIELQTVDGTRCIVGLRRGRNRNISVSIEGRALGEEMMNMSHPFTIYAPGLAGVPKDERYLSAGVLQRIVARGDANLVLRNVLLMLSQKADSWSEFHEDMRTIFPGIEISVEFDKDSDEHIGAYFKIPGGPKLPVDAAGTSILQASQILGYVELFRPRVLILDEPDSHLHPDNQRALCELILRTARLRNFQALISTHSRHVLDATMSRGGLVWLSEGKVVDERDVSATGILLDLGALDSVDYFANGPFKCLFATEDANPDPLYALLESNGFIEEETEVATYAGCSKVEAALVLGMFLKEKAPSLKLAIHRDRDYREDAWAALRQRLDGPGIELFLTEFSDLEGYFLNAHHLNHLNPTLSVERATALLDQATVETREKSIASIVNLRTVYAFQKRRETGENVDHGGIAVEAQQNYESSPTRWRRGKEVIARLTALIQQEIQTNPRIFFPSPFLRVPELRELAARTWTREPCDVEDQVS